jgi:negative regulator of flagellin synthesis FlgM
MSDVSKARPNFFPNSASAKEAKRKAIENMEALNNSSQARGAEGRGEEGGRVNNDARVEIPESVRDFSQIKNAVEKSQMPDRSQKIADLKNKINAGTYEIDYDAVATKMLESEY